MTLSNDHGALMDAVYRNQRHIYDASRKYFLLGRDTLIDRLDPPRGGSVLEIACGTGRNLIRTGQRYPEVFLHGLDISEAMLATSRVNIARAGMGDRVRLARGDATDFDPVTLFRTEGFDRIVLSYGLSMIPDWRGALAQAMRHLAPGGALHVVDFGSQSDLPHWFGRGLTSWLARFHVAARTELPAALTDLAARHGGSAEVTPLYRDFAVLGRVTRA